MRLRVNLYVATMTTCDSRVSKRYMRAKTHGLDERFSEQEFAATTVTAQPVAPQSCFLAGRTIAEDSIATHVVAA
jgi:hypothetical protein